jgi:hypothetical protein
MASMAGHVLVVLMSVFGTSLCPRVMDASRVLTMHAFGPHLTLFVECSFWMVLSLLFRYR